MARITPSSNSPGKAGSSPAIRFAEAARVIGQVLTSLDLEVPVFRSPPRLPGRDRTVRRRPTGGKVVAVRLGERPFAAVIADLVEGACVANGLDTYAAEPARAQLWGALERAGHLGSAPAAESLRAA